MIEKPSFKDRLAQLKNKHGLTNNDLASIVGVGSRTISYYINGEARPDFEKLMKFADYFQCSTDYLLGYTSVSNNKFHNPKLQSWYEELPYKDEIEVTKLLNFYDFIDQNFIIKKE